MNTDHGSENKKIQFCALVGSLKWSTPLDLERHKKEFALRNRFWSACYNKKKMNVKPRAQLP